MNKIALVLLFALASTASSRAASIGWVSFHPGDNTPSANATTAGFTQAPDVGYTSLLSANGHTVTRIVTLDNAGLNAATLNTFDLIILSRSVPSGHYQTVAEAAFWNSSITAPLMSLGGYINRQNRLGFNDGNTIPDSTNNIALSVLNPAHPIFDGIALDGGNMMVNNYAGIATFNALDQRGISVVTGSLTNGVTLATVGTALDPTTAGMIIAEWQTGANMSSAGGNTNTLGGHRLVFLTGSRERDGLTSEGSGIYDLTPDGETMFLNAVEYMALVPEPSTYILLSFGALALLLRRKKA